MFLFKSKKTNKLTNLDKKKILFLKNEFWKRGIKSQKEWFKIKIPFGTPLEFIKLQNKYYLNITQTLKKEILEDI